MAKRRNPITGQWSARPIDMQRSYAWRVLSRAAHQCLSRIEIELADHGGNDIDELPVTFDDFVAYGVHRSAIAPALAELEALGFIDITQRGLAALAADNRRPNKFRLLTRPWEKKGYRPRWERFKSWKDAEVNADEARRRAAKEKSASTEIVPKKVRKPYQRRENASTETVPLASVENRTTIYISGGGAPGNEAAPSYSTDEPVTVPSRSRCRRAGALTLERWGQPQPDQGVTPRPRRAGALSLARWRTRTKPISVHPTLEPEALSPGAPLTLNAKSVAASPTHEEFAPIPATTLLH